MSYNLGVTECDRLKAGDRSLQSTDNAADATKGERLSDPLVVVSGYYGYNNLGDEAILEQLTTELKRLTSPERVIVLSADPERTELLYGVSASYRFSPEKLFPLLRGCDLFISGGGGLFQDSKSVGSCVYYGGQIALARAFGRRCMIYAQGVGPLNSAVARSITRRCFNMCEAVTVRDQASHRLLAEWGIEAERTADPVWCLSASDLPVPLKRELAEIASTSSPTAPLVGVSLRSFPGFTAAHLDALDNALAAALPPAARLLLLPLQPDQDLPLLSELSFRWSERGRQCFDLDLTQITLPSQWLGVMEHLDLLVGMRLHAQIMALKGSVPVVGIAYDPKVEQLLSEFGQPILNLTNPDPAGNWRETIEAAYAGRHELSAAARTNAEGAKKLACQNFSRVARILGMQSVS